MKFIYIVVLMMVSGTYGGLYRTSPRCIVARYNTSLSLTCSTDLANPVVWKYKKPENEYANYIYGPRGRGELRSDFLIGHLGISRMIVNKTIGQYDIEFDHLDQTASYMYQCKDNDDMARDNQVTNVKIIKDRFTCIKSKTTFNDTVSLNLTCSITFARIDLTTDSFYWYKNYNLFSENCTTNTSEENKWTTVISNCMINNYTNNNYTFVINLDTCINSWTFNSFDEDNTTIYDVDLQSTNIDFNYQISTLPPPPPYYPPRKQCPPPPCNCVNTQLQKKQNPIPLEYVIVIVTIACLLVFIIAVVIGIVQDRKYKYRQRSKEQIPLSSTVQP